MNIEIETLYSNKLIIFVLIVLSLFLLGVNAPAVVTYIINSIVFITGYIFAKILSFIGYLTGSVVNKVSTTGTDVVRFTADTVDGTFHSFGDILVKLSNNEVGDEVKENIDYILNTGGGSKEKEKDVRPVDESEDKWCLVGQVESLRACAKVKKDSDCESSQLYKSKEDCTKV